MVDLRVIKRLIHSFMSNVHETVYETTYNIFDKSKTNSDEFH